MFRSAILLLLLSPPVLAQQPTVRHYERTGCGDCAAITSSVRALGQRWTKRVRVTIGKRTGTSPHGHDVEFFLRPTPDPAELAVRLRWTDRFGRPTTATTGQVHVRVAEHAYAVAGDLEGESLTRHGAWTLLSARLATLREAYTGASPWGRPITVDLGRRVSLAHARRALESVALAVDAEVKRWPEGSGAQVNVPPRARVEPPDPLAPPLLPTAPEASDRVPAVRGAGGSVQLAAQWLARHQLPNGSWSTRWRDRCNTVACLKADRDAGDLRYTIGMTALALLALEGAGNTRTQGRYKRSVKRGVAWLLKQQGVDSSIGVDLSVGESIYNHAFATQALCRLAGNSPRLRAAAQRALRWIVQAQNPNLGWKYGSRTGRNDTCVTAAMIQALHAGGRIGTPAPPGAMAGALRWMKRATNTRGEVGYESPGGGSAYLPPNDGKFDQVPVMTAASIRIRILAGDPPTALGREARHMVDALPRWKRGGSTRQVNFYYWYWGSEASFSIGKGLWLLWKRALHKALLPTQVRTGCGKGSWEPVGEWCLAGGRVYGTAINVLSLTTPTRLKR